MTLDLITVTRANDATLERTLASVEGQSVLPTRHIIVSGQEIIPSPRHWRTYHYREPRGVYDAINYGLSRATGDFVGLLHAGDVFSDAEVLKRILETFDRHPEIDYIYSDIRFTDATTGRIIRRYDASAWQPALAKTGFVPPHPTLYMRRGALEALGEYDTALTVSADYDMWLRIVRSRFPGKYIPGPLVDMSPGGLSGTWRARLWDTPRQRLRALRQNNMPANPFRLLLRYFYL